MASKKKSEERIITGDTIIAQEKRKKFEKDHIPTAIRVYVDSYLKTYGRHPVNPSYIGRLITGQQVYGWKYAGNFQRVVHYLHTELLLNGAYNNMVSLFRDYYSSIFQRYLYFNRAPTLKQISPSLTNTSYFRSFVINQELETGTSYWLSKEDAAAGTKLVQEGGTKFEDPIISHARGILDKKGV